MVQGGNQCNHAVHSGVRYVVTASRGVNGTAAAPIGLLMETLDGGLACPMADPFGAHQGHSLGQSTPMGEGMPDTPTMSKDRVKGMAIILYQNLMPISGYAQWVSGHSHFPAGGGARGGGTGGL